ncbi:flagellar motor switch protein FliN [Candidatus Liberibacter asiaticus]|nr:flagellar motor switch protein FliN [Candidatus Liberibacter asiaticus]KAE9510159.1 Flagellar motor switch protein FliN [Candidatus Liberibacter asiaticus]KAE9510950.1 Flagellar motor switch protein FliN [Candidatus Liberibacter asiaticus]KAE9512289.1 Flagellar motor switch protein FliN [Candidatus Liberibacter asiaticus]KAE9513347.1 Flagellar motor switch protein FliN [Candidatus Liberibacter asiaticus]KAE9514451.1 Flagellar motor switch protein FliN [Candidatus Liberibacter asiaticus]
MHIDNPLQDTNVSSPTNNSEMLIQKNDVDNISEPISSDSNNILEKSTDNFDLIMNIPVKMQIILGSCCMQISNLVNLSKGDVITLDKRVGESVDITINNQKIAKGEITIMEEDDTHFGVRVIEILNAQ